MPETNLKITSGLHGVHQYVRLLCTLQQQKKSGLLSIESGRNVQQLFLLEGNVVSVKTTEPFHRRLVDAQIISEEEWKEARTEATENQTVGEVLLISGVVSREEITDTQEKELVSAIEEPLNWERGHWRFQQQEGWKENRFEPSLFAAKPTLLILWEVIGPHLEVVYQQISSMLVGHLELENEAKDILVLIQQEELYESLQSIIKEGIGLNLLVKKFPTMRPVLCFLFLLGFLGSSREKKESVVDTPKLETDTHADTGLMQKNISIIRSDYRRRMQKDYYSFLKVSPDIPLDQLERSIHRLKRRWIGYQESVQSEPEVSKKLSELLSALEQVAHCFSEDSKKREYDRMYRFGRAPLVSGTAASEEIDPLHELKMLVQKGRYEDALLGLKDRQSAVGLSADILAEIGWCQWNLNAKDEAQDSILLALGLDSHHLRALEYDARVALIIGEPMRARKRIQVMLQVKNDHEWGIATLAEIESMEAGRD